MAITKVKNLTIDLSALSAGLLINSSGSLAIAVAGTDIKTVNGVSLLGSGDVGTIDVQHGGTGAATLTGILKGSGTGALSPAVSGTDIKTVGGVTLLGSGDLPIPATPGNTQYMYSTFGIF